MGRSSAGSVRQSFRLIFATQKSSRPRLHTAQLGGMTHLVATSQQHVLGFSGAQLRAAEMLDCCSTSSFPCSNLAVPFSVRSTCLRHASAKSWMGLRPRLCSSFSMPVKGISPRAIFFLYQGAFQGSLRPSAWLRASKTEGVQDRQPVPETPSIRDLHLNLPCSFSSTNYRQLYSQVVDIEIQYLYRCLFMMELTLRKALGPNPVAALAPEDARAPLPACTWTWKVTLSTRCIIDHHTQSYQTTLL